MVCSEIMVFGSVLENVIDGDEDRGCDRANSFLRAASVPQAEELSLVVAALLADGGPRALYQHGLEPGRALAQARGFALAGALVLPRAHAGPGEQMAGGRETAHVGADLGENCGRRHGADPRDRIGVLDQGAKRRFAGTALLVDAADPLFDLQIDLADGRIQPVPLAQVELEQEAVMICKPSMQRIVELRGRRLDLLAGKSGQLVR